MSYLQDLFITHQNMEEEYTNTNFPPYPPPFTLGIGQAKININAI